MKQLSPSETEAAKRLEPAFPKSPGMRALAYEHALSEAQIDNKKKIQECLK